MVQNYLCFQGFLGCQLELGKQHGRDLFGSISPLLIKVADVDPDFTLFTLLDIIGKTLDDPLNIWILELPAKEVLEIKDCLLEIGQELIFGPDAHDALPVAEPDDAGGLPHAVVVGDGLDAAGPRHADVARQVAKVYTHNSHDYSWELP